MGDVLGRVRYRGDSFLIERNGKTVAVLKPYRAAPPRDIREVLEAWRKAAPADPEWADIQPYATAVDRFIAVGNIDDVISTRMSVIVDS